MFAFLSHPLGTLVLLRILAGGNGNGRGGWSPGTGPSPATPFEPPAKKPTVPTTPFPTVPPWGEMPPWPTGWCADDPPAPEVQARAWALLPELWKQGEGAHQTEMTGGRWITYVAEMQQAQKAVGAYRSVNCEAVPPEILPPPPVPGLQQEQQADAAGQALLNAAIAMNEGLKVRGYKQSDQRVYKDFQSKAGLTPDGYPGTNTMLKLELVLKGGGQQLAPVRVYPWKAKPGITGYDGVNAPTWAEWTGQAVPRTSPISPPAAPTSPAPQAAPPPVPPAIVPAAYVTPAAVNPPATATALDAAKAMNGMLILHGYKQADQQLYKAFQSKAGLKADGFPGTNTMLKLETTLAQAGISVAPVKVYPWKSTGTYDGVNAPTAAEWYGTAPAAPAASPAYVPAVYTATAPVQQSAPPGASARQMAAVAMNNALNAHGYRLFDQAIYKAYQKAAGSAVPDGYPGTNTMNKLTADLAAMGLPVANVPIYPWKSTGAYDGVNAPLSSQWYAQPGVAA